MPNAEITELSDDDDGDDIVPIAVAVPKAASESAAQGLPLTVPAAAAVKSKL